jgi:hypothetical protein
MNDLKSALRHGFRTAVRFDRPTGEAVRAIVLGLWRVEDEGPEALVADLADGQRWALRRADGRAWTDEVDATPGEEAADVAVVGWQADVDGGVVAAPDAPREAWFARGPG